jgi:hypothetical protein
MGFLVLIVAVIVGVGMNKEQSVEPVAAIQEPAAATEVFYTYEPVSHIKTPAVVASEPVYERQKYYRNNQGYLVTDLSVPEGPETNAVAGN